MKYESWNFRIGEVGCASSKTHTNKSMLGIVEVPELKEINFQEEFQGKKYREARIGEFVGSVCAEKLITRNL